MTLPVHFLGFCGPRDCYCHPRDVLDAHADHQESRTLLRRRASVRGREAIMMHASFPALRARCELESDLKLRYQFIKRNVDSVTHLTDGR